MSTTSTWKSLFSRPYEKVSAAEALALMKEGAILLDVREASEWRAGHAPKARHVPLSELARRAGELPPGRPIIAACRSGSRSSRAAVLLARQGRQVSNLTGGMHAWARAGLPVVANGGRPGHIV